MKRNRRKFIGSLLTLWCLFGLGSLVLFWELANSNADQIPTGIADNDFASTSSPATLASDPSKLIIPSLGINANVQQVGLTANGNMGVPTGKYKWQDVAWYRLGPKPGEKGNAVMAGHLDNAISLKAVFYDLNELNVGDEVEVLDIDGATHRFRVVEKASYDYKNAPLDKIFGRTDKAMLNLITCGGTWIQSQRSYDERLVVYTELIP